MQNHMEGGREGDRERQRAKETKAGNETQTKHKGRGGNKKERHMYTEGKRGRKTMRDIQDGVGAEEHKPGDTQTRMRWADQTAVSDKD